MKKTLLALAVAGVAAAPAAMAEVTVYGVGHVSVGSNDDGSNSITAVNSNSSRIGVKAAEDLGGGLTAVAQAEFGVNFADPGNNVSARNQFVGLAGGFGTVLAGRHDAPIKMSTGALDVFADTVADYNSIVGINGATDIRANNAIAYVSPNLGGATIAVAYVPSQTSAAGFKNSGATSAAVMWNGGGLSVNFGYLGTGKDFNLANTAGGFIPALASVNPPVQAEVTTFRVGVGYETGSLKVGFIYDNLEAKPKAGGTKGKFSDFLVNAAFGLGGGNTVKASYGVIKNDTSGASKADSSMYAVGFDHAFSKNTSAYVVYAKMDNDSNAGAHLGVVGPGANIAPAGAGKKPSALEVGMVVKF